MITALPCIMLVESVNQVEPKYQNPATKLNNPSLAKPTSVYLRHSQVHLIIIELKEVSDNSNSIFDANRQYHTHQTDD